MQTICPNHHAGGFCHGLSSRVAPTDTSHFAFIPKQVLHQETLSPLSTGLLSCLIEKIVDDLVTRRITHRNAIDRGNGCGKCKGTQIKRDLRDGWAICCYHSVGQSPFFQKRNSGSLNKMAPGRIAWEACLIDYQYSIAFACQQHRRG